MPVTGSEAVLRRTGAADSNMRETMLGPESRAHRWSPQWCIRPPGDPIRHASAAPGKHPEADGESGREIIEGVRCRAEAMQEHNIPAFPSGDSVRAGEAPLSEPRKLSRGRQRIPEAVPGEEYLEV